MSKTQEVSEHLKFDENALLDYLCVHLGVICDRITVMQFSGGQSNPTYKIELGNQQFVLRRKPPGTLLPSAHAIDREYRIMNALKQTSVPVPEVLLLCEDDSVIGSAFYIMRYIEGRIFNQSMAENVSKEERAEIFHEMIDILSSLHQVNFGKLNLADFGKTDNYIARQIHRWTKQYQSSETQKIQAMENLIVHLPQRIPQSSYTSIVHGDYSIRNLLFHPSKPKVLAVLDWELSTLGDPLSDLAYNCMSYYIPEPTGLLALNLAELGIPEELSLVERYCQNRDIAMISTADWNYYLSFSLFRIASICQGVYSRAIKGNAASDDALRFGPIVQMFAELSWQKLNES